MHKKELSCCAGGNKTWVYFSSMQANSPAVGKPGMDREHKRALSFPSLPSVT